MAIGTTAAIIGASALGAGASYLSSRSASKAADNTAAANYQIWTEQRADAKEVREENLRLNEDARLRSRQITDDAYKGINQQAGESARQVRDINNQGAEARLQNERNSLNSQLTQLRNAANRARGDRLNGFERAVNAENAGLRNAMSELNEGEATARGDIQSGFAQDRADTQALRDLSTGAQNQLQIQLGLADGKSAFETQPGYQFLQDEARNQLQGSAAAGGGLYSGATMKALQDRAQNIASLEYNTYLDRLSQAAANTAPLLGAAEGQALSNVTGQYSTNAANLQSGAGVRKAGYANNLGEAMAAGAERAGSAYAGTIDASGNAVDNIYSDKIDNNMNIIDTYNQRVMGNIQNKANNVINIERGAGTAAADINTNYGNTLNTTSQGQVNANNLALQGNLTEIQGTGNAFNQLVGGAYTAATYTPTTGYVGKEYAAPDPSTLGPYGVPMADQSWWQGRY